MKTLLHRLLSPVVLVAVLVSLTAPTLLASSQARPPVEPWRVLVMVYESTDLAHPDAMTASLRNMSEWMPGLWGDILTQKPEDGWSPYLSDAAHARLDDSLLQLPSLVDEWSAGRAAMDVTIVYTGHPLLRTALYGRLGATVDKNDVREDIDHYAPLGRYDSVFAVWRNQSEDGAAVTSHYGVSFAAKDEASGAYFGSIPLSPWFEDKTDLRGLREVFVHEWLHQVISENHVQGATNTADLHDPTAYGFYNVGTWKYWYAAMMNGSLTDHFGVDLLSFARPAN